MQIRSLGWTMPSWITINKRVIAIKMSWCTFFQNKKSGDAYSGLGKSPLHRYFLHTSLQFKNSALLVNFMESYA